MPSRAEEKERQKEIWIKKMKQVRALYEQERQREAEGVTLELLAPAAEMFETVEAGDLDQPVSNDGAEAVRRDIAGSSYGQAGQPTGESPEVESGAGPGRESLLEVAAAPGLPSVDESVLLDAYWASYGDASTRALLRSQPADTSILEVVIGHDDRQEITVTGDYPWRAICSLLIAAPDGSQWIGTGWFVGPRLVVTAGHCVYMHQNGGWATQIEVIPARRGAERPFGSVTATALRSVRGWTEKRARKYDYGAILLPEGRRLGDELGWFGFTARADDGLSNTWVNISGYPGDKPSGTQWFHAKEIARVDERVLSYTIDTAGGQSGAPVWIKLSDGSRHAVGIHTNGQVTGNSATRICQPVFENIKAWKAAAP